MLTFSDFKSGLGGSTAEDLLKLSLDEISSWEAFREAALESRAQFARPSDEDDRLGFYDRLASRYGVASTGERVLILAILHAIDYDAVADGFAREHGRSFFDLLGSADRNVRVAAAACIARVD